MEGTKDHDAWVLTADETTFAKIYEGDGRDNAEDREKRAAIRAKGGALYRGKITVEYERIPDDEARAILEAARERDRLRRAGR